MCCVVMNPTAFLERHNPTASRCLLRLCWLGLFILWLVCMMDSWEWCLYSSKVTCISPLTHRPLQLSQSILFSMLLLFADKVGEQIDRVSAGHYAAGLPLHE